MDGYFGEIKLFASVYAPIGWMFCHGQLVSIATYNALFSLIGTIYGGDGQNNFALPDLRGRFPVGVGTGPGLSPQVEGQVGGSETVFLTTNQLPAHSHTINVNTGLGTVSNPANNFIAGAQDATANSLPSFANAATPGNTLNANTMNAAGGNQAHENMPPYLGLNYIICVSGPYFPARN